MPFTIVRQDITRMKVDAIVNAANTDLAMGGGVCGAIFKAAGPARLQAACDKVSPIKTGGAAITPGFDLPAKFVIHAAGPVYSHWNAEQNEQLLRSAYTESLKLAHKHKCESIAFPLISKILTVDGDAVANPKNVEALIGTRFVDIINFCGGYKAEPRKILMGGPMMGIAIPDDTYPLLKNNNAVLAFTEAQIDTRPETPCIRCARCINACPFQLMPASIEKAYNAGNVDQLKKLKVNLCMECGCCSYVCPAKRPLVLVNRLSKNMLRASK